MAMSIRVDVHGYEEFAADEIRVRDVVEGLAKALYQGAQVRDLQV